MIDALVQGRMHAPAQERISKSGWPFVTAKLTASAKDGAGLFVNVITFVPDTCRALVALNVGDAVALSGELATSIYQDRNGMQRVSLDLTAHTAVTAYHVSRKRAAMRPSQDEPAPPPDHWPPPDAPFDL